MILLWLGAVAIAGWLGDGTSVYPTAPPEDWVSTDRVAWKTDTAAWSNAGPVVVGDVVCVTEEPTSLACFSRNTGALTWRASSDYGDTLPEAERAAWTSRESLASAAEASLQELLPQYSAMQREARRGSQEAMAAVTRMSEQLDALRVQAEDGRAYRTPADQGIIGYATATPLTHQGDVLALFGQGVVTRFSATGRRQWSVWLGPPTRPMRGFAAGHAASMRLVDDTLVVPLGQLRGLDAKTGETRWEAGPYPHFGTPGVAEVGDESWLVLPDGRLLSARDGAPRGQLPCELMYIAPYTAGDRVWCVGNSRNAHEPGMKQLEARAFRLRADATQGHELLWTTSLQDGALYASPVRWRDLLIVVAADGTLTALRANDGESVWKGDLKPWLKPGTVYPSPWVADGVLYVATEVGRVGQWVDDISQPPRVTSLGELRSTPTVVDGAMYVRTMDSLIRIGP